MPQLFTLRDYINATLDKNYNAATADMFRQIAQLAKGSGSAVQRAIQELELEAERLQESDEPMKPDNPALEKTLSAINDEMTATQSLVSANSIEVQESGQSVAIPKLIAMLLTGVTASLIARAINPITATAQYETAAKTAGVVLNIPSKLDFAENYIMSPAWISRMEGWGKGYSDIIADTTRKGLSQGWSPIRTAREIRKLAEQVPIAASENITRTLQLTSYRNASAATEVLNGQYIEKKIRIAKLDDKTCASCIALHGTEIPLGEIVQDHYRGRCDAILVPVGGSLPTTMQADSLPGQRNFVPFQTGEEWFAGLSPERQAQQASFLKSPAKFAAYRDGVPLSEFVGEHEDDVFGMQIVEKSLKQAVDDPGKYYVVKSGDEK